MTQVPAAVCCGVFVTQHSHPVSYDGNEKDDRSSSSGAIPTVGEIIIQKELLKIYTVFFD